MRWGYVIPRVIIVASIWAFFAYGFDPALRYASIYGAQKAMGAKVEIGSLKTGFWPLGLVLGDVRVADRNAPGTNLIEFDSLTMDLSGPALSRKSFVVEDGELSGLRWATPRKDSGLLPDAESAADKSKQADESADGASIPLFGLDEKGAELFGALQDRADALLDEDQFESVRMGKELEKKWTQNFTELESQALDLKAEIDDIQRIARLKEKDRLAQIENYRKAAVESQDALAKIKHIRDEVVAEKQQSRTDFAAFNAARERDLAKIRQQINAFESDPQQIAEYLLGPELDRRVKDMLDWVKTARSTYQRVANPPAPMRMRGEDIVFVHPAQTPKVLIKTLKLNGQGELHSLPLEFQGTLTGLTSSPVMHGEPAVLQLTATGPAAVDLKFVFDYTHPDAEPVHELTLKFEAGNVPPLNLGDEKSFAVAVTAERLTCTIQLKLIGDNLTGKLHFDEQPATLSPHLDHLAKKVPAQVVEVLKDVFTAIRTVEGDVDLSGTLLRPRVKLHSEIGHHVAGGLKTAMTHQVDQGRDQLESRLNDQVARQSGKLKDLFKQKSQALSAQLNLNEKQVQELMNEIGGGNLADLEKAVGNPLNLIKQTGDTSKPVDLKKAEEEVKGGLKKLLRR
ncbi:MAG: TIGR03545 family protein [Planctomycetes bacterium]|nr:TIGR03545 family protein [Planctomycetota bacterium]